MKRLIIICLAAALAIGAWVALASPKAPMPQGGRKFQPSIPDSALNAKTLKAVSSDYALTVAPILEKACFDCHSSKTVYPWYHQLPVVSGYLEHHVEEARKRLDLSDGFPFRGRAPIVMRVRSIGRSIARGSMPLWDYKLMHPDARLSEADKKIVMDWSESSFQKLSETAKPYVAMKPAP